MTDADACLHKIVDTFGPELASLRARVDRGQGTWPESGYIREDEWARIRGRLSVCEWLMTLIAEFEQVPVETFVTEWEG